MFKYVLQQTFGKLAKITKFISDKSCYGQFIFEFIPENKNGIFLNWRGNQLLQSSIHNIDLSKWATIKL